MSKVTRFNMEFQPEGVVRECVYASNYDTALSQLAALREELAKVSEERDRLRNGVESDMAEIDRIQSVYDAKFVQCRKLRVSLADAERRNAELLDLLRDIKDAPGGSSFRKHIEAALNKPEEAKS